MTTGRLVPPAGAAIGVLFFVWIAGARVIAPTETNWVMQGDWRIHYLGWAFFQHEPWHVPPGRIDHYFAPLGTAVGLTDSIPLVAFLVKPFASLLPASVQYLGAWFCLCFALQGLFAVLLMRVWTSSVAQQLLGAACFVTMPTLLMRTIHPSLCAHWLLLWALWLYLRVDRPRMAEAALLALVAGLVHPYLALMTLGLIGALAVGQLVERRANGAAVLACALAATLAGWWLSGLFTVSGTENLRSEGLGKYSMNLLAPITSTGWSSILPDVPIGAEGQLWEGFQYFGLGLLLLIAIALAVRLVVRQSSRLVVWWPLVLVASVFALYALSPRVTFGSHVVFDLQSAMLDRLAIFRATGRFFWPMAYVVTIAALSTIVSRLTARVATAILCAVVAVQVVDLHDVHATYRRRFHAPLFYRWVPTLASPAWPRILPHYSRLVMYPPSYCGAAPIDIESLAWIAAPHGLSINGGLVARFDERRREEACRALDDTLRRGEVDDETVYVGRPGQIELLRTLARQPVVCGVIDTVGICATARSYQPWRDVAPLE